jgi:hypothetical protein
VSARKVASLHECEETPLTFSLKDVRPLCQSATSRRTPVEEPNDRGLLAIKGESPTARRTRGLQVICRLRVYSVIGFWIWPWRS